SRVARSWVVNSPSAGPERKMPRGNSLEHDIPRQSAEGPRLSARAGGLERAWPKPGGSGTGHRHGRADGPERAVLAAGRDLDPDRFDLCRRGKLAAAADLET